MNMTEVVLLLIGIGAFAASFIIPERKKEENQVEIEPELIREMIDKELDDVKQRVSEVVDETLDYAVEKTERASERISNEKIMAISEYSETVLSEMNKTHQEVMFLYDMLNDKHKNIKETVKKVDQQTKEVESKANVMLERQGQLQNRVQKPVETAGTNAIQRAVQSATKTEVKTFKEAPRPAAAQRDNDKAIDSKTTEKININKPVNKEIAEIQPRTEKNVPAVKTEKQVEVYSFAEQAPRVERTIPKEAQATKLQATVNTMKAKAEPKPEPKIKENNNDKILRLYKAGISNMDIAKELGLGVGEVNLVINLFKGAV